MRPSYLRSNLRQGRRMKLLNLIGVKVDDATLLRIKSYMKSRKFGARDTPRAARELIDIGLEKIRGKK